MSTWISDDWRAAAPLALGLAALSLAGCADGTGPGGLVVGRAAPQSMRVAQESVAILGPSGFCIDRAASHDGDEGAFVLLASCAAISGAGAAPASPMLLTASVAPQPGPGGRPEDRAAVLARFFASDEGRAALARDGIAGNVVIDRMFEHDGLFLIHARDRSGGLGPGLRNEYWRAIFDVNGRMVTASAVALDRLPVADETSLAMLRQFADRIRDESARL
jgi:hypothetical protein